MSDTQPWKPALTVDSVAGRYPSRARPFKRTNITAEVIEAGPGRYKIRLDDRSDGTVWFQLHVSVREEGAS
jgi:hypothetical protein